MTASNRPTTKSGLNSLLKGSPDPQSESSSLDDTITVAENVTAIDKADSSAKKNSQDPFIQAQQNQGLDSVPELTDSVDVNLEEAIAAVDSLEHSTPLKSKEDKPEKIKPKKAKQKSQANTGSRVLPATAIVLSLIAIAGSGYSILSQESIQQRISEGFLSIESTIADLTDRSDLFQSSIAGMKQSISSNASEIGQLQSLENDLLAIHQSIDAIRLEADQVNKLIDSQKATLGDHGKLIGDLQSDVKTLAARPKPVVKKAKATSKPKPQPVVINSNSIEGATLSTIDVWGTSAYVVLRDEAGEWIPLQRGDKYKGWRFTGSTGDEALFKKGLKTKKLTVES